MGCNLLKSMRRIGSPQGRTRIDRYSKNDESGVALFFSQAHGPRIDEQIADGMWPNDALQISLAVKSRESVAGRGLLNPELLGQLASRDRAPCLKNQH